MDSFSNFLNRNITHVVFLCAVIKSQIELVNDQFVV